HRSSSADAAGSGNVRRPNRAHARRRLRLRHHHGAAHRPWGAGSQAGGDPPPGKDCAHRRAGPDDVQPRLLPGPVASDAERQRHPVAARSARARGAGPVGDRAPVLFAESLRKGVITHSEAEIMERATRFADRTARDVMVPLERVVTWSFDRPIEENLALARAEKHTRYPVYDTRRSDLVGVINLKALALYSEKDAADREGQRFEDANIVKDLL